MLLPILIYIACFAISLGPTVWGYLSEILPNEVRGCATSVATPSLWFFCWFVCPTFPMMEGNKYIIDNLQQWVSISCLRHVLCDSGDLYVVCGPETKGKTLEEY